MNKHQNKMADCIHVKEIKYPGDYNPYFDKICYLQHEGVICNDINYGFEESPDCNWYTECKYVGNNKWHLVVKSLRKITSHGTSHGIHHEIEPITAKEYEKAKSNPSFSATGPKFGPHKTIKLRATRGKYKGCDIEVKMIIKRPYLQNGGGGGGGGTLMSDEHECEFQLFQDHGQLDKIYGWSKYYREFKKNIWCFNTRNPEIKFISRLENTNLPAQQNMIRDMFCSINENLEYHIEKAKLAGELKDEKLLAEYGNMIDFVLNQRFELTIKSYIDKITKHTHR
jgi:hypothetical protein